jgi:hypothetical protein
VNPDETAGPSAVLGPDGEPRQWKVCCEQCGRILAYVQWWETFFGIDKRDASALGRIQLHWEQRTSKRQRQARAQPVGRLVDVPLSDGSDPRPFQENGRDQLQCRPCRREIPLRHETVVRKIMSAQAVGARSIFV